MSTGSAYKEGTPLTSLTTNVDRGYERKPGGASGSGQDTDDNSADFALVTPNKPQNKLSTCVWTGSTNPSGVGAASPSTVTAGSSTLLTVTVTPGTGPASTGLAVSGDLTLDRRIGDAAVLRRRDERGRHRGRQRVQLLGCGAARNDAGREDAARDGHRRAVPVADPPRSR